MSKQVTQLIKQFVPDNYRLHIAIGEDKKTFSGTVCITGKKVGRPSERITLHQKGLKITKVSVTHIDKKSNRSDVAIKRIVRHASYDEVRIHADEALYPGSYEIKMEYSGVITKNMDGIYPCLFKDTGAQKQLIATQFESHHAREAFPCIDEPAAKAVFTLTLTHNADEIALSNTEIVKTSNKGNRATTEFEPTPVMSTYLLAFVIGELEFKEINTSRGVRLRTYATKDQVEYTDFALSVAAKSLDFYEKYYDIPFPLSKCDFVALPDFASGAMENWGLITFREQALLCDESSTSLATKQWVAIVVAHELTHQWFGNLVTMRWWTDLWLNEGFASWMEYLAIDTIFPEWHMWTQFAVDEQQLAMRADSLEHTHPIEVPVKHPDEIRTIFDTISYQKGASVIHMLHDYLGADVFRNGIRHYLKKFAYKNTDTIDLWNALEEVSGKKVTEFMSVWTSKSGYPLLQVSMKDTHLRIRQQRFVINPTSPARHDTTLWPVPLLAEGLQTDIITQQTSNIELSEAIAPLTINAGQTGFYRVDYSHELQQRQIVALKAGTISDIDRMSLLSDGFETTRAGYQPVTEFLDLLEHYRKETSLSVWEIIASSIGAIRQTLSTSDTDDTLRDLMRPFVEKLTSEELKRLGFERKKSESHLDSLLRPLIFALSAGANEPLTLHKSKEWYEAKIAGLGEIPADLRTTVYATAARLGGQKEYNELLNLYKNSTSSDEKLSITAAMTSFEDTDLHAKVLALITDTDTIRLQDVGYWIAYSFMNRHGRNMTWQWMRNNWDWLKENTGTDLSFSRNPVYAARNFADSQRLNEYIEFFTERMEPSIERSYNQGLEILETNIAWRERDAQNALNWFNSRSSLN